MLSFKFNISQFNILKYHHIKSNTCKILFCAFKQVPFTYLSKFPKSWMHIIIWLRTKMSLLNANWSCIRFFASMSDSLCKISLIWSGNSEMLNTFNFLFFLLNRNFLHFCFLIFPLLWSILECKWPIFIKFLNFFKSATFSKGRWPL